MSKVNSYVAFYVTNLGIGSMYFETESSFNKYTIEEVLLKIKSDLKVDEVGIMSVIKLENSDEED